MTSTVATTSPATQSNPSIGLPVSLAVALSALMTVVLVVRDTDSGPAWRVGLILSAAIVVVAAIVFGLVVRRTLAKGDPRSPAKAALILGVFAALSVVVFWMAVTPVLGIAAMLLAHDARDRRPFRGEIMANLGGILGALATVAGLVLCLVG